jgi:predicted DNA-binding ribbon-helix-helix protein
MDQTRRHGKSSQLEDFLKAKVIKRSVSLAGHMTSVSLEEPFWEHLNRIAAEEKIPVSTLILRIDEKRQTNLSSALRLFVLYSLSATK